MKRWKSLIAGATALGVLATASPSHAVYQKVETFEDRYAMIDTWDCTALSVECTEVFVAFGFDEASAIQPYAVVEIWEVDLSGFAPVYTLVERGSWYDATLSIFIATNRKTATLSGEVEMSTGPCDSDELTCEGPPVTRFIQAAAAASSTKAGSLKKSVLELPPCKITQTGSYSLRRSKTGTVSVDSIGFNAVPVTGSVIIEKDNIKVTSRDCLGLGTGAVAQVISDRVATHLAKQQAAARHKVVKFKTRR